MLPQLREQYHSGKVTEVGKYYILVIGPEQGDVIGHPHTIVVVAKNIGV